MAVMHDRNGDTAQSRCEGVLGYVPGHHEPTIRRLRGSMQFVDQIVVTDGGGTDGDHPDVGRQLGDRFQYLGVSLSGIHEAEHRDGAGSRRGSVGWGRRSDGQGNDGDRSINTDIGQQLPLVLAGHDDGVQAAAEACVGLCPNLVIVAVRGLGDVVQGGATPATATPHAREQGIHRGSGRSGVAAEQPVGELQMNALSRGEVRTREVLRSGEATLHGAPVTEEGVIQLHPEAHDSVMAGSDD